MKKIFSISLWGDDPLYINPILENTGVIKKKLPDWSIRIYHDETVPGIERFRDDCELIARERHNNYSGLTWRHQIYADESVDRFFVIDSEILITDLFIARLRAWEQSEKPFYILRLHPSHVYPILAGYHGGTRCPIPDFKRKLENHILNWKGCGSSNGFWYGVDTIFMIEHVWPEIEDNHLAFIKKGCHQLKFTGTETEV